MVDTWLLRHSNRYLAEAYSQVLRVNIILWEPLFSSLKIIVLVLGLTWADII